MSFHQFFEILRARWRTALATTVLVTLAALAVSLLLPKKYLATASVLLDISSPDPVAGVLFRGMETPGYMATQIDLIKSERVALRATDLLKLDADAAQREQWQTETKGVGDFRIWLAEGLQTSLDVEPSRESNVLTISYSSSDPAFAAAAANAFMQAYIDVSLELRVEPARQFNAFFDERAKQLRDALSVSQAKLSAFERQNGLITSTDGRLDIESSRLSELSSQLVVLQALSAESGGRQAQAGARPDQLPEVVSNSLVANLTSELARDEARLRELTSRLGDNNPQVIEQRVRVSEMRARVDAAVARASGSVGVDNSINKARVAQVRAALEAQRARVAELKALRDQASVLERDVENAQKSYDEMLQRLNQTSVESKTTRTNVSVLKRASQPLEAASPNKKLNVIMGLIVGLTLGLAIILMRELFDRRLRSEEDVLTELRQPLLVRLPVAGHGAAAGATRERLLKARVLTGLPRPAAKG